MTPPNALVALRVLLAMPIAVLAAPPDQVISNAYTALLLFVVAVATDILDGALARRMRSTSRLGGLLDSVADKVLVLAVLLPIAGREPRVLPTVAVLVARDLLVSALRLGRPLPATPFAKLKTALLYTACATYLYAYARLPARDDPLLGAAFALLVAGTVAALLSAGHYLYLSMSSASR